MPIAAIDFQLLANAGFPPAKYQKGEVIFSEGDKGDERDGKIVETLSPGGIFGEMALIDGSPRAATARAKTACEVAPITEKSFLFLVHETPFFAIAVMRALAERLRLRLKPALPTCCLPLPLAPAMIGQTSTRIVLHKALVAARESGAPPAQHRSVNARAGRYGGCHFGGGADRLLHLLRRADLHR